MTLTPAGLRCAHKVDPLGVAQDRIRFSWILEGTGASRVPKAQTAYQILVTTEERVAWDSIVWDSGQVRSAASADITYGGPPLAPGARYRWKVRAWDEAGYRSAGAPRPASRRNWTERVGGTPPG